MTVRRRWFVVGCIGAGLALTVLLFASRLARPESRDGTSSTGTDIGQQAPAFEVRTTDGATLRSKDLRGQIIILTSAAVWCQTCALEAEQLASAYNQVGASGVTFLTVDIDPQDTPAALDAFRAKMRTPWAYASAGNATQLIRDFELSRFEITYVIDGQGIVRYRDASITSTEQLTGVLRDARK